MNRRATDPHLYKDFRDLAVVVLFTDRLVGLVFMVLMHL